MSPDEPAGNEPRPADDERRPRPGPKRGKPQRGGPRRREEPPRGQAGAVNRSRPMYEQPARPRRGPDGRPGDTRGGTARGPRPAGRANDRPQRPYSRDANDRPQRPYVRGPGDRPQRPFTRGANDRSPRGPGDRPQRPYTRGANDRPAGPPGDRPQRPYTRGPGDRPQRPYTRGANDRPARPPGDRPQRPYTRGPGDRPQRPYTRGPGDRPQRPYARGPGDRPQRPYTRGPGDRPQRPYTRGPGDRPQRPFSRDANDRPQRTYSRGPNDRPQRGDARRGTAGRPPRPYDRGDRGSRPYDRADRGPRPPQDNGARGPAAEPFERREAPLPSNPREAALRILFAVDTRSAFSDRLLDAAHGGTMSTPDRALMHELVKGTLRWRGRLDWALEQRVHLGFTKLPPWIRNVLRLGAYQLVFLDRVPAHSAVDESVKLANQYGHPGTAGLVNSVLRRIADEKDAIEWPAGDDAASLAVWGSHPEWIVTRWLERFGLEATRAMLLANNRPSRLGLRANALRTTRDELVAALAKDGATAEPAALAPELVWIDGNVSPVALGAFRNGLCTAQDESECLVARLLAPERHERVLDLCAAPGGKTTHIAEMMHDDGDVWAMERQAVRIESIAQNLARLDLHSVHALEGDGRSYPFPMPFDRVLVDAPCSGLGVLGRRADARWRKLPSILHEMPPVQLELLASAARHARPGGVLVYSVCSFEPEETVEVVERLLTRVPGLVLESAAGILPEAVVDADGFMRVLPHVHGCDGAFAARFRRT